MEPLRLKCPICSKKVTLSASHATCENGHLFPTKNGIYKLVTPEYAAKLHPFLRAFETFETPNSPIIDPERYPELPYVDFAPELWSLRRIDLQLVLAHIKSTYRTALEIGAWNGWLTQHLVKAGLETVAIDHFTDATNGLGAKKYYPEDWTALQVDLEHLDIFDTTFDVIVVNRCLNYFTSMEGLLAQLKKLLAPDGVLILTGITLERDASKTRAKLAKTAEAFENRYHTPFFFKAYKGYLDKNDLTVLRQNGIHIRMYRELLLRSLLGKITTKRPSYYYGIFKADHG